MFGKLDAIKRKALSSKVSLVDNHDVATGRRYEVAGNESEIWDLGSKMTLWHQRSTNAAPTQRQPKKNNFGNKIKVKCEPW